MPPTMAGKPAESTDKTASSFRGGPDTATLTRPARHGAVEVRRIEELPLHLAADARHGARADLPEQSCCRATACKKGSRKSGSSGRAAEKTASSSASVNLMAACANEGVRAIWRRYLWTSPPLRPSRLFLISMQRRRRHRDHRHHHRNAFAIVLNQRHDERHRAITSDPLVLGPLRR